MKMSIPNASKDIKPAQSSNSISSEITSTLVTFLGILEKDIMLKKFAAYQNYYDRTWASLKNGSLPEAESMGHVSEEHIQIIVKRISNTFLETPESPCQRQALREITSKDSHFADHSDESIDRTIDLALRLWLVLNIRDDEYTPGAHSIQWEDGVPLQSFIVEQFPKPRLLKELYERMFDFRLPDNFTMVNLKRYSAIKVHWTYDLSEHLDLDRNHRVLKVFPLKYYLNEMRQSKVELLPDDVIDEYNKTINMLFPSWDTKTQSFLKKNGQTFGMEAPVDYPGPLYLSDFNFWRDRLSTLYTDFCSPPPSMTQLFRDRRNVLQWYTFWFAVVILVLTVIFGVISSITAILSTRYTYESLLLTREAVSMQACPTVACGALSSA